MLQTFPLPLDVPLLPARILSAGSVKCMYENGNLRYVCLREMEAVRMIYGAVRDENWETASYEIRDEVIEESEGSFTIKYTAFYQLNRIHYKAAFEIEGKNNTISFSMKGVALNRFQTNRIGICVHHPVKECAGKKVLIKQHAVNTEVKGLGPVGSAEAGSAEVEEWHPATFPVLISPHQPFKRVQQMKWSVENGVEAQLTFEGDVFETEDQRNWTDASFKTYSRPLDLPFPVWVNEGETMEQEVTLKIIANNNIDKQPDLNSLSAGEIKVPFPKIGYCRRKGSRHLTETEIKLLQKVPFDHYRVELQLDETSWQDELAQAFSEAGELATKLELVVFFGGKIEYELQALIDKLQDKQQYISSLLTLHKKHKVTPQGLLQYVYQPLKDAMPGLEIGYGTDAYFADLNRNRPKLSTFDFVSYSINPQVHAFDTRSLSETLEVQADTVKTAEDFIAGKAIHVSPVTLKKRGNPDAASFVQTIANADVDPRQYTWYTAHWTLQSIKSLSGATRLTFYEAVGPKGIIRENEFSSAEADRSEEALLSPVYRVLAAIKAFEPVLIIKQNGNNKSTNTFLLENTAGDRLMFITTEISSSQQK